MKLNSNVWLPHLKFTLQTMAITYPSNPNDVAKKKYYDEYKPKEYKTREIVKTRKKYIEFAVGTILVGLIIYLYKK